MCLVSWGFHIFGCLLFGCYLTGRCRGGCPSPGRAHDPLLRGLAGGWGGDVLGRPGPVLVRSGGRSRSEPEKLSQSVTGLDQVMIKGDRQLSTRTTIGPMSSRECGGNGPCVLDLFVCLFVQSLFHISGPRVGPAALIETFGWTICGSC